MSPHRFLLTVALSVAALSFSGTARAGVDRSYDKVLEKLSEASIPSWSDPTWVHATTLELCVDDGLPDACAVAGILELRGHGVPTDTGSAFDRFGSACDLGLPPACQWRAWMLATGSGIGEDEVAALAELQRGCEAGDKRICGYSSVAALKGRPGLRAITELGPPPADLPGLGPVLKGIQAHHAQALSASDPHAAIPSLAAACSVMEGGACEGLVTALADSGAPSVSEDSDPSMAFFDIWLLQRACKTGASEACGRTRDLLDDRAEAIHAWLSETDRFLDKRRAWLADLGCEAGEARICELLVDKDSRRRTGEFLDRAERGCADGDLDWCAYEARHHPDFATRKKAGAIACDGDHARGCYLASRAAWRLEDEPSRRAFLARSCRLDFVEGCNLLATLSMPDLGEEPWLSEARPGGVFEHGCSLDDAMSCLAFGRALWVEESDRATEVLSRACDLGESTACGETLLIDLAAGRAGGEEVQALVEKGVGWWMHPASGFRDGLGPAALNTGTTLLNGYVPASNPMPPGSETYQAARRSLGRALLKRACDEGMAEACARFEESSPEAVAAREQRRENILADPERWPEGCEEGMANACWSLAESTDDCRVKMPALFEGCEHGSPDACASWAIEILIASSHPVDSYVSSGSCAEMATGTEVPLHKVRDGAARALAAGVNGLGQRCDAEDWEACLRVGRLMGGLEFSYMAAQTDAAKNVRNDASAFQALERACEHLGPGVACLDYAKALEEGRIGPEPHTHTFYNRDYRRAAELYQQACDEGVSEACLAHAWLTYRHLDPDAGLAALLEQCRTTHPETCHDLAVALREDLARAEVGAEVERISCDQGIADSCHALGMRLESGRGVERDPAAALTAFAAACAVRYEAVDDIDRPSGSAEIPEACLRGAALLSGKRGLPADPARQRELLVLACRRVPPDAALEPPALDAEAKACAALDASSPP